jgi:hypothetical protein
MTTNLPATFVEAEALQFARNWLATIRAADFLDSGYKPFDPAASHAFVRRSLRQIIQLHPLNAAKVVEYAVHGLHDADIVLRELIAEKIDRGEPLGAVLGAYNIRIVHPDGLHRHRGRSKVPNLIQDIMITCLVLELIERFQPLKPTRSQIGRKQSQSACGIAAIVLAEVGLHRGGEQTIQQIWRRYAPSILPGYQWPHWGRGGQM